MDLSKVNSENEMVLIANSLFFEGNRKYILNTILDTDYLYPIHYHISKTLRYLHTNNIPIDLDVIISYSATLGFNDIEYNYLNSLKEGYNERSTNLDHHIKLLKLDKFKYDIRNQDFKNLFDITSDSSYNLGKLREEYFKTYKKLIGFEEEGQSSLESMYTIMEGYKQIILDRQKGIGFYPTGFYHLDTHMTEGFAPKKITTVAARPGCGKSSFVYELARRLSNNEIHVFIYTLEMDKYDIMDKYLSAVTGIPIDVLVKEINTLSRDDRTRLDYEIQRYSENPYLHVSDKSFLSLDSIINQISLFKTKNDIDYFVTIIDLFGQISDFTAEKSLAQQYEIKLDKTKNYVKEIGGHWMLVNQIGRMAERSPQTDATVDGRPDLKIFKNRPSMAFLKNSGKWEEVSDNIFLLFRAKYYDPNLDDDILEVNIDKQRKGKKSSQVYFEFLPSRGKILPTRKLPYDKRIQQLGSNQEITDEDMQKFTENVQS